jgi:hypothetical protein
MSEGKLHSLILACDYRVDDVARIWELFERQRSGLAAIGVHHVVGYISLWDPGRILVTMGIRHPQSVRDVLRSPAIFELFDTSGVDDIPPIFGGEVVEKIELDDNGAGDSVTRVIVGAVSPVPDVLSLMAQLHARLDRFRRAGVRKVWVYRELDDGREVMILQEVEDAAAAREWISHPDTAAEWMSQAGCGAYPAVFVGRLAHVMTIDQPG